MKKRSLSVAVLATTLLAALPVRAQDVKIQSSASDGSFAIVSNTSQLAPIVYDSAKDHSVVGIAASALSSDIKTICGQQPEVTGHVVSGSMPIIIGTLGQSDFIDQLANSGKLDVSSIKDQWEAYTIQVLASPQEGIEQALVIAGSTPRGTAYGVFELSKRMGVSPWIWWADVTPEQRKSLYATAGKVDVKSPSVKYRGLFINDEDWGLQPWAAKNMDTDIKDIGPKTYERVFELMLRLRANIMWPAMHPCTKAFWYYKDNPEVAKRYDIVLGSSHCEPMLRSNVFEWGNEGGNSNNFNYATNASGVQKYWAKRVGESKNQDVMYTLGMRGVHDGAISGYSGADNIAKGLTDIIGYQRQLITDSIGDPTQVPQMFCPYKEVLDAYNTGKIGLPDDVTLCWVDDNHGYIRQFPNETEQKRSGSNGIYYHLSYWGSPQDYLWLSSISPSLISYELSRGYEQGIQRLWMINVGDIKPAEEELEFCMDLAWDIDKWNPTQAAGYSREWAARTFGEDVADDISAIKLEYYRLAAAGKPEHVSSVNYTNQEMNERIAAYQAIADKVDQVKGRIPERLSSAYFQLIEYPVKGACLMNIKHFRAKQSIEYAAAGKKDMTLEAAAEAKSAYEQIQTLTDTYNTGISDGKWNGIMSSKPRAQATFNMPSVASADDVMGVETALVDDRQTVVPASQYTSASSTLAKVSGLGLETEALTVWPMNENSLSATEAPWAEYDLPVVKGTNVITVRCLPTFPLTSSRDLRYAVSVDNGEPVVQSIKTTATSAQWSTNVLRGWVGGSYSYQSDKEQTVKVRVAFMDPGIVLSDIVCTQQTDTLTDQYLTNADFEYKAEGVLNSGGETVRGLPYGWNINTSFPGDSYGINKDGKNLHGDNLCWFYNKTAPMPDFFQLSQVAKGLPGGTYRVKCLLWAQKGNLGTVRLFANNNVQYYGKSSDYVNNLTEGEINSFAGYEGTSSAELKEMQVTVTIAEGEDLEIGVRTSNQKSNGSRATAANDVTGWFKCDYFRIEPCRTIPFIINPGFSDGTNNWTIDHTGTANVKISTGEKPQGSDTPLIAADQNHLQIWGIKGSGSIWQTVSGLEPGRYEVGVVACHTGNVVASLFANDDKTPITEDARYSVETNVVDGTLKLGVEFSSSDGGVLDIDAFTLRQVDTNNVYIVNMSNSGTDKVYDLYGREVKHPQHGLFIKNNKKYILK